MIFARVAVCNFTFICPHASVSTGYDLLKKKSDALSARLRSILREIKAAKEAVVRDMAGATFSISEAAWSAGDFRKKVRVSRACAHVARPKP